MEKAGRSSESSGLESGDSRGSPGHFQELPQQKHCRAETRGLFEFWTFFF